MKKYFATGIIAATLVGFSSCKKEPQLGDCFDIPPPNSGWGYTYESPPYGYLMPCFSPVNPNQFVYYERYQSTGRIKKYDLSTGISEVVCQETPFYKIRWGKANNITFNRVDNCIWVVKSNGDSLRQITNVPNWTLYPEWTDNGENIIYYQEGGVGNRYFIKISTNGDMLDTLSFISITEAPPHACSVDGGTFAISVGLSQKYVYNLGTETYTVIDHTSDTSQPETLSFSPDGTKLLWTSKMGIRIADIETQQTSLVKPGCVSKMYHSASMSADGSKIIATRTDLLPIDANTLYSESNIVIMNIDGSDEHIVELPH